MTGPTILVTGATGNTGRPLTAHLLERGARVKAASRHPESGAAEGLRFDWYDPATFDDALAGVDAAYLVPPPLDPDPRSAMTPFLDAARRAGLARVVLLSASAIESGGPGAGRVHELISRDFEEWAVLRPSWFTQNFIGDHHHAKSARETGVITTATGRGRIAFIDVDDIAAVAAQVLLAPEPLRGEFVLTGPEALGYDEVAAVLTEVLARAVRHEPVTAAALEKRLRRDLPGPTAAMLATLDEALALGAEDRTTDTVERLTGRPPRHPGQVLREHFAA